MGSVAWSMTIPRFVPGPPTMVRKVAVQLACPWTSSAVWVPVAALATIST